MPAGTLNFSPTTPAPPTNQQNVVPQNDGGSSTANQSFYDPIMVGDSGSGGKAGNVPAPAAGDAAAGKFLKADGTFAVPSGSGSGTFFEEVVSFSGTSGTLSHTPVTFLGLYQNGLRLTSVGGSPDFSRTGTAITLTTAGGSSDEFVAIYYY
jgi:hypothetical protein